MKFKIDTSAKTIELMEAVNIEDLVIALRGMLGETYKEYKLVMETYPTVTYPWYYPIYIPYDQGRTTWTYPVITCDTGTYCVEVQDKEDYIKN